MLTMKGASHINTKSNIKGLHSCRPSTGVPLFHVDLQRLYHANMALALRRLRRDWLASLWQEHLVRCRWAA